MDNYFERRVGYFVVEQFKSVNLIPYVQDIRPLYPHSIRSPLIMTLKGQPIIFVFFVWLAGEARFFHSISDVRSLIF